MSSRKGVGLHRGATSGPQPLRATIPYQLHRKVQPNPSNVKSGKTKMHQLTTGIRRTLSLDAIVGPYLQGHWPKECEVQESLSKKDQSTQTPVSWSDEVQSRRVSEGHKRSASWGSAGHLQEIAKLKQQLQQQRPKLNVSGGHDKDCQQNYAPGSCTTQTWPVPIPMTPLDHLAPRLRRSVEGLNQELEGMFISQPPHQQCWIPEIPDGHRAPVPPQSCYTSSQCESSSRVLSPSYYSSPSSSPSFTTSEELPVELDKGSVDGAELCLLSPFVSQGGSGQSSPLLLSSSPRPNKSYCFQREPPEGCEKVRVYEETSVPRLTQPVFISSRPDPNKINFTPHGGSAFCPVSLIRPLLPSMDLLFRSLAVVPATGYSSTGPYQVSSSYLGPVPDSATTAI